MALELPLTTEWLAASPSWYPLIMGVATAGLCEQHELPLDADGECELCRLNAIPSKAPPTRATSWIVVGVAAVLLGGGVLAFLAAPKPQPEPPPRGARNTARQAERAPAPSRAAPPARPRMPDRPSSVPLPPTPTKSNDRVNTAPIPVPPAAQREQRTFTEEDARAALAEVQIEMYATSWCPSCRRAREYLDDNQISYTEYDIDEDAAAKQRLAEINPRTSIPTFQIDDIVQVGFSPENFQQQLNQAVRRRLK